LSRKRRRVVAMHLRSACLLLSLCLCSELSAQSPPDAFNLVLVREDGPLLIRIEPRLGDRSVQARFRAYLKKWFDYLDRNGDGKLEAKELVGAPKAFVMSQLLRTGAFFGSEQNFLTLGDLKTKDGAPATFDDFADYYRRNNIHALSVAPRFGGIQFA